MTNAKAARYATGMAITSFVGMSAAVLDLPGWAFFMAVSVLAFGVLLHLAARASR